MKLQAISLLTLAESDLAERIRAMLKEYRLAGRLVFKTQPTTFIDPDWTTDFSADLRHALFTGVILFSIVKGMKRSRLVMAIIDSDAPTAELVVELLRRFGINVLLCDLCAGFAPVRAFISSVLDSERLSLASKPVTNQYERWLLSITDFGLNRRAPARTISAIPNELRDIFEALWAQNRKRYLVFHEVALPAFIHFDLTTADPGIDIDFAMASRLDVLVTGEAPDYVPLLAIEFDGPHHQTAAGNIRDKKKEAILLKASIPLLRVGFEDAPPLNESSSVIDLSTKRNAVAKERLLIQLIGSIVRKLHRKRVDFPQRWKPYWDEVLKQYKASEERTLREMGRTVLSVDVRERLLDDAMRNLADLQQVVSDDIAVDDYGDREFRKDLLDPDFRSEIKKYAISVHDIECIEDDANGFYCQANLVHAGKKRTIRTPSVHFRLIGADELTPSAILNEELQIWLLDSVARWAESEVDGLGSRGVAIK